MKTMCKLSNLCFPLDKELNLPPLGTSRLKCVLSEEEYNIKDLQETFLAKDLTYPFAITPLLNVPVSSAKVLCEGDSVKTIIEVILDISECNLNYLPGDTIGILPKNDEREVNDILNRLNLFSNHTYKIEILDTKKKGLLAHVPSVVTVKYLFDSCLDLRAIVKKTFLRALVEHTFDETEKRRIMELCSREGSEEYNECVLKPMTSIIDILKVFPSCKPPLSLLIEHIPRLQPRPYSIASSPLADPEKLRIVFNIVHDSRERRGVCSGWLYDITRPLHDLSFKLSQVELSENIKATIVKVPVYLRKPTNFRIPENPSTPLIMIGTGTGIAPFIGFLEHRRQQLSTSNGNKSENWIIFGCRQKNNDDIFRNVMMSMEKEKICNYHVAYSRDKDDIYPKYVQDIMRSKQKDLVDQLLKLDTKLFVCGNGLTVTKDIIETVVHLIAHVRGVTEEEAKNVTLSLEKKGQIVKELWK